MDRGAGIRIAAVCHLSILRPLERRGVVTRVTTARRCACTSSTSCVAWIAGRWSANRDDRRSPPRARAERRRRSGRPPRSARARDAQHRADELRQTGPSATQPQASPRQRSRAARAFVALRVRPSTRRDSSGPVLGARPSPVTGDPRPPAQWWVVNSSGPDGLVPEQRQVVPRDKTPDTIAGWKALVESLLTNQCCAFHRNMKSRHGISGCTGCSPQGSSGPRWPVALHIAAASAQTTKSSPTSTSTPAEFPCAPADAVDTSPPKQPLREFWHGTRPRRWDFCLWRARLRPRILGGGRSGRRSC